MARCRLLVQSSLRSSIVQLLLLSSLALLIVTTCEEPQKLVSSDPPEIEQLGPIQILDVSYNRRDIGRFVSLLANDPATNAVFRFYFESPDLGQMQWGRDETIQLHQRMFRPDSLPPGADPVPQHLWLRGIAVNLIPKESFQERPDLYSENGGQDGKLLPERWRAKDATYSTYFFFDTGETEYLVGGEANFVVIEDLTKSVDEPGKFLIYSWEEICNVRGKSAPQGVTETCLSRVVAQYR